MTSLTATVSTPAQVPRVPIPANGVDYRGKIVLAPMVRSGELPSRLLALHYGADLVWGPETIDRALIGAVRQVNPRNGTVEFTRYPSNGGRTEKATKASVIYRIDPAREKDRLVFQLGSAEPELAVQAARVVAGDVSGIDLNSGCPKPFSTHCGMGAALLKTPDKLVAILEALVREVGTPFNIGISVKIRILSTAEETEALSLTVHCRTTPMRPRERAIRDQLRMIADICHKAGVACVMNGDVTSRDEGLALMQEYGVDGAMIATAAEANSSCFRSEAAGGLADWDEVAREYMRFCIESENKFNNTKYLLNMLVPGKHKEFRKPENSRTYADTCRCLGFEELIPAAIPLDERLGLAERWSEKWLEQPEEKKHSEEKAKAVQNAMQNNETARAAGGETRVKSTPVPAHTGGPIRTTSKPAPVKTGKPKGPEPEGPADLPVPSEVVQQSQVTA
ncbi:tRNA-dihydrouridine(20) synthase [Penicillium chermesinum]|uniref:tRNA-dihydrouridine(20) synthase n=1 Tax=Penicillium chermesinum TaxID=63820 RepID=A0A9W9NHT0_9EURO|nr:tRNA-dihydrouridine(20) synthase [Penicillium chermesinum]KAJ5220274.1 tRNA-dihydrouridine(20) synthase [Penicillium chermesinum]